MVNTHYHSFSNIQNICVPMSIKAHTTTQYLYFYSAHTYDKSRDSSVGIVLGYGLDDWGFDSRQGLGIFLFTTASQPTLGPTQPPIQWVPGTLSLGVKRPRSEADHSPPSSGEVKECVELYLHSPIHLRGMVLS
jgi:hypothetical protein